MFSMSSRQTHGLDSEDARIHHFKLVANDRLEIHLCDDVALHVDAGRERSAVLRKPGNTGGGKGPQFKTDARRGEGPGLLFQALAEIDCTGHQERKASKGFVGVPQAVRYSGQH